MRSSVNGPMSYGYTYLFSLVSAGLLLRRRAAPRLSAAQMRAALDHAGLGLMQIGLDGRLLTLDARCRGMLGVGSRWRGRGFWNLYPTGEQAAILARFARLVRTGETFETVQRVTRRDGGEGWVHCAVSLARRRRGRPRRAVAVLRDVTAQRAAEAGLHAAAEMAERNRVEQGRHGSQRMELLGQLASGIAHDFNNVLQAIIGGTRLIQRHAQEPRTVARLTGLVEEAAERGAFVTQRLLAFARHGRLQPGPIDVPLLLDQVQEALARTLGEEVAVSLDVPAGLPPALADRGQLELVLASIAVNARDAILKGAAQGGPGRGSLVLRAAAERVEEDAAHGAGLPAGAYLLLAAADTGAGMTPAELARATEPFFTTKPLTRGTGLSLAMARGFAEQSGGRLAIESAPGRGTTVKLWLPQAEAATEAVAEATAADC